MRKWFLAREAKALNVFLFFFFQLGLGLRPSLVLAILIVGHVQSQSVEQLLEQAKTTGSVENLLADAVVEKSEDSLDNSEENLVKLMRSKTSTTSTTTEPPISNRRRLLFRPRDEQRTKFFNRVRTRTKTASTTTTSRQPSILFAIYYFIQLIKHPISWIPKFCLFTFWVFFTDKSFKLISKYTLECQYILVILKRKKHFATP